MTSYLPSMPTFQCKTIVEDAPLKALPAAEEEVITHLQERLQALLEGPKSPLHAQDPWRTLTDRERKYLYLRFARYHVLNTDRAETHIRRVADWRTKDRPWETDVAICSGVKAGLPFQLFTNARGCDGEILLYLPARLYIRANVDHAVQQLALKTLFEFCLYASEGCRAASGVYVLDFSGLCFKNVDLVASKNAIRIFQSNYPEPFKRLLCINYPKWIYGTWKIIMQMLDARSVGKVAWLSDKPAFVELLCKYFNLDDVPTWLCGNRENEPMKLMNSDEAIQCTDVFGDCRDQ